MFVVAISDSVPRGFAVGDKSVPFDCDFTSISGSD